MLSHYEINLMGENDESWPPVAFNLKPGAYRVILAFGCWRDDQMVSPGELTLMIGHPGEATPRPARADEIWRPATRAF